MAAIQLQSLSNGFIYRWFFFLLKKVSASEKNDQYQSVHRQNYRSKDNVVAFALFAVVGLGSRLGLS